MNMRFYQIKQIAKRTLSGHFGLALLVTIIPPLVYGFLGTISGAIFSILSTDLANIIDTAITGYGTFISIALIIRVFQGETNFQLEDFFFFDERVVQYFLLSVILFFLGFTVFIPFYNQIANIADLPMSALTDGVVLEDFIESITPLQAIGSLIAGLISIYLGTRLIFAPYIIIDQRLKVLEAIKKSWTYTRGKFWYVFFFPLSFILWVFLIIPTLFLILLYLIPYVAFSIAALYFAFKEANGDGGYEQKEVVEEVVEVDILDDDLYR